MHVSVWGYSGYPCSWYVWIPKRVSLRAGINVCVVCVCVRFATVCLSIREPNPDKSNLHFFILFCLIPFVRLKVSLFTDAPFLRERDITNQYQRDHQEKSGWPN